MVRALAREPHAPIAAGDWVEAPSHGATHDATTVEQPADGSEPAEPGLGVEPAKLFCNLGDVSNLAVARGSTCLFTRVSPFGIEGIAQKLAERRRLTLEHARQWLVHVGLEQPLESIDGDPEIVSSAREALAEGAARLVVELRHSLEFYSAQEGATVVEGVIVCGPGTTIPGLAARLERDLGQRFELGRPGALSHLSETDAARLTLPYGLALEG
jgi:type IV pilus assembly protein PilM